MRNEQLENLFALTQQIEQCLIFNIQLILMCSVHNASALHHDCHDSINYARFYIFPHSME